MNERDKIIGKIKKCFALSSSSNEHEAAAALRQAIKLMEQYGISDLDMQAAEAGESRARSRAIKSPASWEEWLAGEISQAFGCECLFSSNWIKNRGEWSFVGTGSAPEVASYAFSVLMRQAQTARASYIKTRLKRCKPGIKTRRADIYCEGWVNSVTSLIKRFAVGDANTKAIEAYIAKNYPALGDLKATNRNSGRGMRDHEFDDLAAGIKSGRDAQLNRGVGAATTLAITGSAA